MKLKKKRGWKGIILVDVDADQKTVGSSWYVSVCCIEGKRNIHPENSLENWMKLISGQLTGAFLYNMIIFKSKTNKYI